MNAIVTLDRMLPSEHGVFGACVVDGGFALFSLEEEWRDNQRSISCIPAGTYDLEPTTWHKHGIRTYEIANVPDRDRILIHPGNTEEDTEGCVIVGMKLGWLRVDVDEETFSSVRKMAVLQSRVAFQKFMQEMGGRRGRIIVKWQETPSA